MLFEYQEFQIIWNLLPPLYVSQEMVVVDMETLSW